MSIADVLAPLRSRYATWLGLDDAAVLTDRDEDPATIRAIQLLLRLERDAEPGWHAALAAAASGCAALCLDPRAEPGGQWHAAVRDYCGGHIRKVTRRGRGAQWRAAADLPGLTVTDDASTEVRVLVPGLVGELDRRVSKLQVGGTDLPVDDRPVTVSASAPTSAVSDSAVSDCAGSDSAAAGPAVPDRALSGPAEQDPAVPDSAVPDSVVSEPAVPKVVVPRREPPVLTVLVPGAAPPAGSDASAAAGGAGSAPSLTAGKLMAQTGHAGMLAACLLAADDQVTLRLWRDAGCPSRVERVDDQEWARLSAAVADPADGWRGRRLLAVRDAGFTEVAPGTVTVIARFGPSG